MKPFKQTFQRLALLCIVTLATTLPCQGKIFYVRLEATGTGDGSDWTNAYNTIQSAINASVIGDTIFVAEGVFYPTHFHGGNQTRHQTFYIGKDIRIFGGFAGTAGSEGSFDDRDVILHKTILSGDIGIPDNATDNAFHVVYLDHVSSFTIVDGFTITKGYGTDGVAFEALGAGIFNDGNAGVSNPIIANCIIEDNHTRETGGGMTNQAQNGGIASPILFNCTFINNTAAGGGAIMSYADTEGETNPMLINCRFIGNAGATAGGGALQFIAHSSESSPDIINCLFTGNHAPTSGALSMFLTGTGISNISVINSAFSGNTGGSMRLVDLGLATSTAVIRNTIIWGNGGAQAPSSNGFTVDASHSIIPFGFPGEGNIGLDPLFVLQPPLLDTSHILGDLHLLPGSPAFDAGNNDAFPTAIMIDIDNLPRFVNSVSGLAGIVDIGPYEFQAIPTSVKRPDAESRITIYPNPTNDRINITVPALSSNGYITISDTFGKTLQTISITDSTTPLMTIDLSGYTAGVYFVGYYQHPYVDVQKVFVTRH